MSFFQQSLWWVDETEAQWQHFKKEYGHVVNVHPVEVNFFHFDSSLFGLLPSMINAGAAAATPVHVNRHVGHVRVPLVTEDMVRRDEDYKGAMGFSVSEHQLIVGAQF